MSLDLLVIVMILFIVGGVQDWMSALYLNAVTDKKYLYASFISVVHTILNCLVWVVILKAITGPEQEMTGAQVFAYSLGGGFGTYIGLTKKRKADSA